MATTVKLGEEITIGTTATEYVIDTTNARIPSPNFDVAIECAAANSGTIQFSVGETVPAANRAYAASAKTIFTIQNGVYNLWAKGSASGQKFTIS